MQYRESSSEIFQYRSDSAGDGAHKAYILVFCYSIDVFMSIIKLKYYYVVIEDYK